MPYYSYERFAATSLHKNVASNRYPKSRRMVSSAAVARKAHAAD